MTKFSGHQNHQLCVENRFSQLRGRLNFGSKNQEAEKRKKDHLNLRQKASKVKLKNY